MECEGVDLVVEVVEDRDFFVCGVEISKLPPLKKKEKEKKSLF